MSEPSQSDRSKAVVDAYYQAGADHRLTDFGPYLHPDFTVTAPNYLPWGGVHRGADFFRDQVLPNLPDASTSAASATRSSSPTRTRSLR